MQPKFLVFVFAVVLACSQDGITVPPSTELAAAPTTIVVESRTLRLDPYIYVDSMPSARRDQIIGLFSLIDDAGSRRLEFDITEAYLVSRSRTLAAFVTGPVDPMITHPFKAHWRGISGVESPVDIVVRVRLAGGSRLLRTPDQPIKVSY